MACCVSENLCVVCCVTCGTSVRPPNSAVSSHLISFHAPFCLFLFCMTHGSNILLDCVFLLTMSCRQCLLSVSVSVSALVSYCVPPLPRRVSGEEALFTQTSTHPSSIKRARRNRGHGSRMIRQGRTWATWRAPPTSLVVCPTS